MAAYVDNFLDRGALKFSFQEAANRGDRYLVHCRERRLSFGGRGGAFDEYVRGVKNARQIFDILGERIQEPRKEAVQILNRYSVWIDVSTPETRIIRNVFDTRRNFDKQMDWQEKKRGNICREVPATAEALSHIVTPPFGKAYATWLRTYEETQDEAQATQTALEDYPQGVRRFLLETLGL